GSGRAAAAFDGGKTSADGRKSSTGPARDWRKGDRRQAGATKRGEVARAEGREACDLGAALAGLVGLHVAGVPREVGSILAIVEVDECALIRGQVSGKDEIDRVELGAVALAVLGDAIGRERNCALAGIGVEGAVWPIAILQRKSARCSLASRGEARRITVRRRRPYARRRGIVGILDRVAQDLRRRRVDEGAVIVSTLLRAALSEQHAALGIESNVGDGARAVSLDQKLGARIGRKAAVLVEAHRPDLGTFIDGVIETAVVDSESA